MFFSAVATPGVAAPLDTKYPILVSSCNYGDRIVGAKLHTPGTDPIPLPRADLGGGEYGSFDVFADSPDE
jgi:hypothetical protein